MPDKHNIDKDYLDLGWNRMNQLLEQELPVEEKNRRFLFWWIGAGAAIALVAWMISFSPNNQPNTPQELVRTIPANKPGIQDNAPIRSDYKSIESNISTQPKDVFSERKQADRTPSAHPINLSSEKLDQHLTPSHLDSVPSQSLPKVNSKPQIIAETKVAKAYMKDVAPLPKMELSVVTNYFESLPIVLDARPAPNKKVRMYLKSGGIITDNSKLGYSIGAVVEYPLVNRLSVGTGVQFKAISTKRTILGDSDSWNDDYTLESQAVSSTPGRNYTFTGSTRLLEIPMYLDIGLIKHKLNLQIGGQYSYLIHDTNQHQIEQKSTIDNPYQKHNLGFISEIEYSIGNRWSVSADYKYNPNPVIRTNQADIIGGDIKHFFGIGVAYRWR